MIETAKTIYNHFVKEEIKRNISIEKTKEITVDSKELNKFKLDTIERFKIKLKTGKYSEFILEQLAIHRGGYGEKFGNKIEYYNASEILDLIELLENNQINGTSFKHPPLKGCLHIHHSPYASLGYSIERNIREYWFSNKKIKKVKREEFERIVTKYGKKNISPILNTMHQEVISKKELRGEWLIYKKYNGKNYYLCLASHNEGDRNIFNNKISKCFSEFSEMK